MFTWKSLKEGAAAQVTQDASNIEYEEGESSESDENKHEEGDTFWLLIFSIVGFVTLTWCLVLCFVISCRQNALIVS